MYSVIMIFLIVVGSFAGAAILPGSVSNNYVWKQQLKTIHVADAPAASELIIAYPFATEVKAAGFKAVTGPALAFVVIVQSPAV